MKKNILILTGIILVSLTGCHKKDPDPCNGLSPVSANFTIDENFDPDNVPTWKPYFCDTILSSNEGVVNLTANQGTAGNTKYTWKIGTSTYTKKSFKLNFGTRLPGMDAIPITLSVQSDPNRSCFPNDSGKATFTKNLVIKPIEGAAFLGTFVGKLSGYYNKDLDTVQIAYETLDSSQGNVWTFRKIDQTDSIYISRGDLVGYKEFYVSSMPKFDKKLITAVTSYRDGVVYPQNFYVTNVSLNKIKIMFDVFKLDGRQSINPTIGSVVFEGTRLNKLI